MTAEEYKLRLQVETMLLVWVRTSLALMGFGFVIARFGFFLREIAGVVALRIASHPGLALANNVTGTIMILTGVVVMLLSVHNHRQTILRLDRGDLTAPSMSVAVGLGLFVAMLGIAMATYLILIEM